MSSVLILYYSRHGATESLARAIALGVELQGATATLRTVPSLTSGNDNRPAPGEPESGPPFVCLDDLRNCSALALGSPTRFGNMAAPLKHFLDSTSALWLDGALINKPACVFTSTSSMHGGQESTLLSMMLPLLHHGMVITGLPYSEPALHNTQEGGSPYGATHVAKNEKNDQLSATEKQLCIAQGKRLAMLANAIERSEHT